MDREWIEITRSLNLADPPQGLPKGFIAVGARFEVPTNVAKPLIAAHEAKKVSGPHVKGSQSDDTGTSTDTDAEIDLDGDGLDDKTGKEAKGHKGKK